MCGIYGMATKNLLDVESVFKSTDKMFHRGPNGGGANFFLAKDRGIPTWRDYKSLAFPLRDTGYELALAHRRLSIIDLGGGHQPMCNEDGNVWITFNGEIYNFPELRKELETAGHVFRSHHSDTEVIVHAYEEWGPECVNRFNGMFAFVIYDKRSHRLFMARDRIGKKPFFYRLVNGTFEFASEAGALHTAGSVNPRSLNFFLSTGYIPNDLTLFTDLRKLPPAHVGFLDLVSWKLSTWKYWTLPLPDINPNSREEDLIEELDSLLNDAVKIRLVSDVPLGVFLSGGLDSSLVAAVAAKHSGSQVKTFTISFPGAEKFDESSYAELIAKSLKTDHRVLQATDASLALLSGVSDKLWEPLGDSSFLPTYLVSKLSSQHVKVAIGGDGADELLAGYSHYKQNLPGNVALAAVPRPIWKATSNVAGWLPPGLKGRNFIYSMRESPRYSNIWRTSFFDVPQRKRLLKEWGHESLKDFWCEPEQWKMDIMDGGKGSIDQMTRLDFLSYLPEDILVKVDRASMLNSLETRSPWLDYRLVEFAFRKVPADMKVRNGQTKWIQKRLAERYLPKAFKMHRKQGFSIPLDDWLKSKDCHVLDEITKAVPAGINKAEVEKLVKGLMRGRKNGARLYALWMLGVSIGAIRKDTQAENAVEVSAG